jgi:hypothetical protein
MIPPFQAFSNTALDASEVGVLHTLMYFDVFRHPLTTDEIRRNCQWHACCLTETAAALEELQQKGIVEEHGGFWFLAGRKDIVALRAEREERALHFMHKAKRYSRLISAFPFVRAVCISGSLSKGTMDPKGDIDYFIITEPQRLWIARTLLVAFKKIFMLNSRKYFCVNYFIDTNQLSIPDRNLFVATEISFIRPMSNGPLYEEFMKANRWTELFYPNSSPFPVEKVPAEKRGTIKRVTEKMLDGKLGEWLDERLLRLTLSRWRKKFPHVAENEFEIDFRSRRNVSKHHPQGFQRKVSAELDKRIKKISEESGFAVPAQRWEWTSETDVMKKI